MNWIVTQIKWIMLVSGVLTCSMLLAALAPQVALQNMFGDSIQGPIAEIVVRNWGALIALGGGMLIYGAYNVASRSLVLVVAVVSKLVFITLVLSFGPGRRVSPCGVRARPTRAGTWLGRECPADAPKIACPCSSQPCNPCSTFLSTPIPCPGASSPARASDWRSSSAGRA
ncbi:MAG: hypothetical protein IPO43_16030 [Rhodoferax sp.]|nr:hypothetical protein [Rhodoferax sp.]